ncbi:SDR family oxidoreductase [Serratia sp. UGAL515B_01]|uniref:SDR family oxidoreductase n=1 Tax=Serratia sp. UGAL515B_01 TaxID=2986763 RepID=UPI0029552CF2|nr:NAD(P)H-binding protein [Serratia sp. UGAL515B_01]WON78297.1 NAD(P)H-binding protein [Serratia sp. UGAL515B_01]
MTYIVHGATGAQGAPLFKRLLQSGKQAIAAVRHTDKLSGMPTIQIDNASVDSLVAAYRGAEGVFIHLPLAAEAERVSYARNIVKAIELAKPKRVVISTSGAIIDEPDSPLQALNDSAIAILIDGVQKTGVSTAVLAPRLYLENLLLPMVFGPAQSDGTLRYPIRADFPVSWSSHLDVAEVAERLFNEPGITGVVGVGQLPGMLGADLAQGMAKYLGRHVTFESLQPQDFGTLIEPLFGPAANAVVGLYQALWQVSSNTISATTSAQQLLNMTPRNVEKWLADTLK